MKMQRSTAKRLVTELSEALETAGMDEDITLSNSAMALIHDAMARDKLSDAIDNELM